MVAHLEEVVVFSASEWVVFIGSEQVACSLGGLDVPEDVIGNGCEDLLLGCGFEARLVGVFEILDVVVFLVDEGAELLVHDLIEVVHVDWSFVFLKLLHQCVLKCFFIFLIEVPDLILGLSSFI